MEPVVYLGLGSNVGDRLDYLRKAVDRLPAVGLRVLRVSPVYETEPVDLRDQPWFLNCVVEGETDLAAADLLAGLQRLERALGRRRETELPKGPRTIDIDILLFGSLVVRSPGLTVPHPRMERRRFVLTTLAALAPDLRHPVSHKRVSEMLAGVPDRSAVRLLQPWG
jgi:2-amino-4-hydroxy-6-hydroxymethyldihydropteridine diphosphokinase